jgi:hypothetical protein
VSHHAAVTTAETTGSLTGQGVQGRWASEGGPAWGRAVALAALLVSVLTGCVPIHNLAPPRAALEAAPPASAPSERSALMLEYRATSTTMNTCAPFGRAPSPVQVTDHYMGTLPLTSGPWVTRNKDGTVDAVFRATYTDPSLPECAAWILLFLHHGAFSSGTMSGAITCPDSQCGWQTSGSWRALQ